MYGIYMSSNLFQTRCNCLHVSPSVKSNISEILFSIPVIGAYLSHVNMGCDHFETQ